MLRSAGIALQQSRQSNWLPVAGWQKEVQLQRAACCPRTSVLDHPADGNVPTPLETST